MDTTITVKNITAAVSNTTRSIPKSTLDLVTDSIAGLATNRRSSSEATDVDFVTVHEDLVFEVVAGKGNLGGTGWNLT